MPTATALEQLAGRLDEYVRFVHQRFFRRLSNEDARDVAQDAFAAAAASSSCQRLDHVQLDLWLRRAAYHKALDLLRKRDGQGATRRADPIRVDELADTLADPSLDPERHLLPDDTATFRAAFARLPQREQRVLRLRHFEALPVEACADIVGVPKAKYERLHTDAVRRLVNLVVGIRPHDTCRASRKLIDASASTMLDRDAAARRDAHLAGCLHCRGYQRRAKGLAAVLPMPAVALAARVRSQVRSVPARVRSAPGASAGGSVSVVAKVAAVVAVGAVAVAPHPSSPRAVTPRAVVPTRARPPVPASVVHLAAAPPLVERHPTFLQRHHDGRHRLAHHRRRLRSVALRPPAAAAAPEARAARTASMTGSAPQTHPRTSTSAPAGEFAPSPTS